MKRTLIDNILKLNNTLVAINYLTNKRIYYNSNYPPQAECDKQNIRHLKGALKNAKRLMVVITKQSKEEVNSIFTYRKMR